mgnify:CR=1 FL=1
MPLFKSDWERRAEAEKLIKEDRLEAADRATIGAFYNGRQTMSDCEAEDNDVNELINHLFGFKDMDSAKKQLNSLYNKDPNMWKVVLRNVPAFDKARLEFELTKSWNKIMKDSNRLKGPWKGISGELTLYGSGQFVWATPEDWCPMLCRPLVPRGTGTMAEDLPYAIIPKELSLLELERARDSTKRLKEEGIKTGWKLSTLNQIIDSLKENVSEASDTRNTLENTPNDQLEEMRQGGSDPHDHLRTKFQVFYIFERNEDGGFDWTIITRSRSSQDNESQDEKLRLFHRSRYFETAKDFICPFFIDVNIEGETTWHRTMGLGRLNYDTDKDVEEFFNEAMEGAKESVRSQYQVENGASLEIMQRWIADKRHSNIIPEGLSFIEKNKNPNFQFALTFIEQLRALSSSNKGSAVSNSTDKTTNELEVQALERQGQASRSVSERMNDIYTTMKIMGATIWCRFTNPDILETDDGYDQIKAFQNKVLELGIPIEFLSEKDEFGNLVNVEIKEVRSAGDGDSVREIASNQFLKENLSLYGPDAQKHILRRITASTTQDYELAEELVPDSPPIAADQITRANNENDTCLLRGITGHVPKILDEDIHLQHIPEHIGGLQGLVARGNAVVSRGGIWPDSDIAAVQCLGTHTYQHIQFLQVSPDLAPLAGEWMQQLSVIGRQADKLIQISQSRQAEQEIDPIERAKLQQGERKLALQERAQKAVEQDRNVKNSLSRTKQAFDQLAREEQLMQTGEQQDLARQKAVADVQLDQEKLKSSQQAARQDDEST